MSAPALSPVSSPARPVSGRRRLAVLVGLLVLAATILAVSVDGSKATGSPDLPISPAIEQQYGVRFTLVGVTADGGLVDVRFVVLNAELASDLMTSESTLPRIVTERNDKVLPSAAMMPMEHVLTAGRTYSVLYRNTAGAVRAGDEVSLVFPGMSLSDVIAS